MARILILGGTGAMGKHLVELLENTDNEVVVTSRSVHTSRNNIRYIRGNAHDKNFVLSLLSRKGVDVMVNFMTYNTLSFQEVVDTFLNNCGQYVHLSTARVYSNVDEIITEDTPRLLDVCQDEEYLATDEYSLTKARQEDLLQQSGKNNFTIIRPYITYSEQRLQLGVNEKEMWLYRALKGHAIVFSNDIAKHHITLTYGQDVARGIVALVGKKKALGEAFHITSGEIIKWSDVLAIYQDVIEEECGFRPRVVMEEFSPNLKDRLWQWQVKYDRWFDRKFDNSKINKFLDTDTFTSPREGLRKCLVEFLKNPRFKDINWRKEAKLDRLSHELYTPFTLGTYKDMLRYYVCRVLPFTSRKLETLLNRI